MASTALGCSNAARMVGEITAVPIEWQHLFVENLVNYRTSPLLRPLSSLVCCESRFGNEACFSSRRAPCQRGWMLKMQRAANAKTVFRLIGRMDTEEAPELQKLFQSRRGIDMASVASAAHRTRGFLPPGIRLRSRWPIPLKSRSEKVAFGCVHHDGHSWPRARVGTKLQGHHHVLRLEIHAFIRYSRIERFLVLG